MAAKKTFPQAGFLGYLETLGGATPLAVAPSLPALLSRILFAQNESGHRTKAADHLIQLLKARQSIVQALLDTERAADELRRYQKFARPGQPSPHIVGLRQKQAAARQASSLSKQSFIKAAAAFVRDADIDVPQRVALEVFIDHWIDTNVPKSFVPTA